MCSNNLEQFLDRISNHKVSVLSTHSRHENHIELKGPNEDDPVICFDIRKGTVEGENIAFR